MAEGAALVAVCKEALGREARDGNHGPVPEDGRGCKACGHGGHTHALVRGLHLGQVVQIRSHPTDWRPEVNIARAAQGWHHQLCPCPLGLRHVKNDQN